MTSTHTSLLAATLALACQLSPAHAAKVDWGLPRRADGPAELRPGSETTMTKVRPLTPSQRPSSPVATWRWMGLLAAALMTGLLALPGWASVTLFDNKAAFDLASVTTLRANFEGFSHSADTPSVGVPYTEGGVVFTAGNLYVGVPGGAIEVVRRDLEFPITSNVLTESGNEDIVMTFLGPAPRAMGFDFITNRFAPPTITVFDTATNLIATLVVATPPLSSGFFSIVTTSEDIGSVRWLADRGEIKDTAIDNIVVGSALPEPSTLASVLTGLALLTGWSSGRRRRANRPIRQQVSAAALVAVKKRVHLLAATILTMNAFAADPPPAATGWSDTTTTGAAMGYCLAKHPYQTIYAGRSFTPDGYEIVAAPGIVGAVRRNFIYDRSSDASDEGNANLTCKHACTQFGKMYLRWSPSTNSSDQLSRSARAKNSRSRSPSCPRATPAMPLLPKSTNRSSPRALSRDADSSRSTPLSSLRRQVARASPRRCGPCHGSRRASGHSPPPPPGSAFAHTSTRLPPQHPATAPGSSRSGRHWRHWRLGRPGRTPRSPWRRKPAGCPPWRGQWRCGT